METELTFESDSAREARFNKVRAEYARIQQEVEEDASKGLGATYTHESLSKTNDSKYQCLNFDSPALFLIMFLPYLRSGQIKLHPWQIEILEDIAYGRTRDETGAIKSERYPDSINPYKFCLCACNGSGKDNFIVAGLAVFMICCKIQCKVIITSASGTQLTTQTEHYITILAKEVNNWFKENFGQEILKIRQRHIYCILSGSVIHLFATDEGEKAEGHHPMAPGKEMVIIVNEAKSVSKEIFDALRRCTGYNFWLDVSSPGQKGGEFWSHWNRWENKRRVTFFDCPHHSPEEFELDKEELGEHSPLFLSKWMAEFANLDGKFVMPQIKLSQLFEKIRLQNKNPDIKILKKTLQNRAIRIGIDIAASTNGDESVCSIWRGNTQIAQRVWRIKDTTLLATAIHVYLLEFVRINHEFIFADDGGVGRGVIDQLCAKGWSINRVLNNSTKKVNKNFYRNKGAQTWYKVSRLVEYGAIIFLDDAKLFEQLAARKYKEGDGGQDRLQLQSKEEAKNEGMPSPDRADAAILAFTDCNVTEFLNGFEGVPETLQKEPEGLTIDQVKNNIRRGFKEVQQRKPVYGSVNALLKDREYAHTN